MELINLLIIRFPFMKVRLSYSWITPAGVGFSSPEGVHDSFSSALDILNFLDQLRKTDFNGHKFADQPLHIMGASYAGHYISALGLTIATAPKYKGLNIRSLIMANPSLDERRQYE